MHEHPEDHDKIEKLKDLIAWQVKNLKSGLAEPAAVERQLGVTLGEIQTFLSPGIHFLAI